MMLSSVPYLAKDNTNARYKHVGYAQVEASGPASPPLGFPAPLVRRGERRRVTCFDPSKQCLCEKNVLIRSELPLSSAPGADNENGSEKTPKTAYLFTGTQLKLTLCGEIVHAIILQKDLDDRYYETNEEVAIKIDKRKVMRQLHDESPHAHPENPWKEVSAMELMGNAHRHHPNVVYLVDALYDDQCLYEIMPYYSGGSLYQLMNHHQQYGLPESQARTYFQQILAGIEHMHNNGVCHRDISTHNILLNQEQTECKLIDFGMCLRIPYPYPDDHQTEDVTDIGIGTTRRIIHSQSHCGKLRFMAPEMYSLADFDGLTVDLWSAAVVLFVMLTGRHPYEKPDEKSDAGYHDLLDSRYYWDPKGVDQVFSWGHTVSKEAVDLLKRMFRPDPRDRPTFGEVLSHPWVTAT